MPHLSQAAIHEVYRAAIACHLAEARDALWAEIDAHLQAWVPRAPTPGLQLMNDLKHLNVVDHARDGSIPLDVWLNNAELIARPLPRSEVFGRVRSHRPNRPPSTNAPRCAITLPDSTPPPSPAVSWTPIPGVQTAGEEQRQTRRPTMGLAAVGAALVLALASATLARWVWPSLRASAGVSLDETCAVQLLTVDWAGLPDPYHHNGPRNRLRSLDMPLEYFETKENGQRILWALTTGPRASSLHDEATTRLGTRVGEPRCEADLVTRIRAGRALPR